jgi:hypothetical protein
MTADERTGSDPAPRLSPVAVAMLEGIYQHRLISTAQLRCLYTPEASRYWTANVVRRLERAGLVASVRRLGGMKLAYVTPGGADAVQAVPHAEPRRKLLDEAQAQGPLQRHTLAVNDVGLAFVEAARVRGDGFGPLSWRHELAHPIGPPPGRRRPEELIADALLTYEEHGRLGVRFHYRFLELDRNTMPLDLLVAKLVRYARLYRHTVESGKRSVRFWETRYPVLPTVLLVLDGGTRERLRRRRHTVLSLCAEHPDLRRTPQVEISACLLEDLKADGPFAAIWRTKRDPARPVNWLGEADDADHACSASGD